jgi:ABC-type phosphate/phosphonate transport system substrate-binding protein
MTSRGWLERRNKTMKSLIRTWLFTILVALVMVASGFSEPGKQNKPASGQGYLNVGFPKYMLFDVDIKDAQVAMELWANELSKINKLPLKTRSIIIHDLPSLVKALKSKQIDVIGLPSVDYLKIKDEVSLEPALGTVLGGKHGEEYVLITRIDEAPKSLKELRNNRLVFQRDRFVGNVPLMWLDTLLIKQGLPVSEHFFADTKTVNKVSQAVLPVFFKQMDACLVTRRGFETMVELNPQLGEQLKVLSTSPVLVLGVVVFRKDFNEEYKKLIINTALNFKNIPSGKQILTLFRVDDFFPFHNSDLDSLIGLLEEYKHLRHKKTMAKIN